MQLMSHSSSDESEKASLDFDNIHVATSSVCSFRQKQTNSIKLINCIEHKLYYNCNNNNQ